MIKVLHKIANLGIEKDTPFGLRNKLRVFNSANLVIIFINLFYLSIGIVNHFYIATAVTIYSILSNVLAFILVYKKKYNVAFHYTMWYAFLFLSAFSILFGPINSAYYYYLFLPVACNILFDNLKTTLIYLGISIIMMVTNVYYIDNFEPHYHLASWMKYLGYPNLAFSAILIYLGVRLFKQENLKYAATIEEQKKVMEEKNHEITDSINYAKKIQSALIPSEEEFGTHFKESFVLLKPKDIVSGDFYWITKKENKIFFVAADCTGHGVPGGFMTMLGISFLDEIVTEKNILEPNEILNQLRDRIIHTLKQTGTAGESKDGMDVILCCLDITTNILTYSAANNSLYVLSNNVFNEYKPDKQPCGFHHEIKSFTQHHIQLTAGDIIYAFSDGYADQFGGPKGKKFKYKQLEEKLKSISDQPMIKQKKIMDDTIETWRGNLEQVDDVLVIGVRI